MWQHARLLADGHSCVILQLVKPVEPWHSVPPEHSCCCRRCRALWRATGTSWRLRWMPLSVPANWQPAPQQLPPQLAQPYQPGRRYAARVWALCRCIDIPWLFVVLGLQHSGSCGELFYAAAKTGLKEWRESCQCHHMLCEQGLSCALAGGWPTCECADNSSAACCNCNLNTFRQQSFWTPAGGRGCYTYASLSADHIVEAYILMCK